MLDKMFMDVKYEPTIKLPHSPFCFAEQGLNGSSSASWFQML
jgi:hypothetical protein